MAVEQFRVLAHAPLQRVRTRLAILRGLTHDPIREIGVVSRHVRDGTDGGAWGSQNERGGTELRRVCGVQHGGDVPGEGGEGGAVLCWGVFGRKGHEGGRSV